jgi:RNA polymerase sigma factor (TIGR02999 family)
VYEELRLLAAQKMAQEQPGQTLQPTALVHEAYLRLVASGDHTSGLRSEARRHFANRGHFFAAAAQAMQRILVDRARERQAAKRGGSWQRVHCELEQLSVSLPDDVLLDVDTALTQLAEHDPEATTLVRLHVFGGLSVEEAGAHLGMARATAYRQWAYARAWLRVALEKNSEIREKV